MLTNNLEHIRTHLPKQRRGRYLRTKNRTPQIERREQLKRSSDLPSSAGCSSFSASSSAAWSLTAASGFPASAEGNTMGVSVGQSLVLN